MSETLPSLEITRYRRRFEIELFDGFFDEVEESREMREAELIRAFKNWLADAT